MKEIIHYSKYLHSLLCFFQEIDLTILLDKINPILDDSTEFYYNYVQYDDVLRCQRLFDRIFDLYIEEQNYRVFWCMWKIIHSVPLVMVKNNIFISHFYKTFIISKTDCINCIMHYITYISEITNEQWDDSEYIFAYMVSLHNEINENTEKDIRDEKDMKTYYQQIVDYTLSKDIYGELVVTHHMEDINRLVQMNYSDIISKNIEINKNCTIYFYDGDKKKVLAKFCKNILNTDSLKQEIIEQIKSDTYEYHTYNINHTPISDKVYDDIIQVYCDLSSIDMKKQDSYHMFYNTNTHSHQDSLYEEYGTVCVLKQNDVNGLFVFNHFDIYFKMEENDLLIFDKSKYHYNTTDCELSKQNYRLALNFI